MAYSRRMVRSLKETVDRKEYSEPITLAELAETCPTGIAG